MSLKNITFTTVALTSLVIILLPFVSNTFDPRTIDEHIISIILMALVILVIVGGATFRSTTGIYGRQTHRADQLTAEGALFVSKAYQQVMAAVQKPDDRVRYNRCQIALMPGYVALYPASKRQDILTFNRDNIRWVDRPDSASVTHSEFKLSIEINFQWYTLFIRLPLDNTSEFEQALLTIIPDELKSKRNRQRPEKHYGPVDAQPVNDTLAKIWDAPQPVQLYLTPLWLVILGNGIVIRAIALDDIEAVQIDDEIWCLGVTIGDETLMFETPDYRKLGEPLKAAAR